MRKEEIRHDPIRENIVKGVEYLKDNQSIVIKIFFSVIILVAISSYYSYTKSIRNDNASNIVGMAQSAFIKGEIDNAMVKFERVLNDYPNTNAAYQAAVYLLSSALAGENYADVLNILSKLEGDISNIHDPVIKSTIYKIQGDMSLKDGKLENAVSYYRKAANNANTTSSQLKYELDICSAFLAQKKYNSALKMLENIVASKEVGYTEKNKAEELLAYAKKKIDS